MSRAARHCDDAMSIAYPDQLIADEIVPAIARLGILLPAPAIIHRAVDIDHRDVGPGRVPLVRDCCASSVTTMQVVAAPISGMMALVVRSVRRRRRRRGDKADDRERDDKGHRTNFPNHSEPFRVDVQSILHDSSGRVPGRRHACGILLERERERPGTEFHLARLLGLPHLRCRRSREARPLGSGRERVLA
jgi:hypothetical protein